MSRCTHDENLIVWDEDDHRYRCEVCRVAKCPDCGTILVEFDHSTGKAEVYCGRCDDGRNQIEIGIA